MRPNYLAYYGHVVNALPPIDINGGKNSDVWSMENYSHATIVIQMGVTGGTSAITLEECDNFTPDDSTAIAFDYYPEVTAAGDVMSPVQVATSSGFTSSVNNSIFYVIEFDATNLTDGYPNMRVVFATPGASVIASCVVLLSGSRFASIASATAIA